MSNGEELVQSTFYIPKKDLMKIKMHCVRNEISQSKFIRDAVKDALVKNEKKLDEFK